VVPGHFEGRLYRVRPKLKQFINAVKMERNMPTEGPAKKKSTKEEKKEYIVPLKTPDEARSKGTKAHERYTSMRLMAQKNGGKVLKSSAQDKADYRPQDLNWDLKRKNVKVVTS